MEVIKEGEFDFFFFLILKRYNNEIAMLKKQWVLTTLCLVDVERLNKFTIVWLLLTAL